MQDIKLITRRAKRLRNVYFALGVIISFCDDLTKTKFKKPISIAVYTALVSFLKDLRCRVQKERELLDSVLDSINRFGSDTVRETLKK